MDTKDRRDKPSANARDCDARQLAEAVAGPPHAHTYCNRLIASSLDTIGNKWTVPIVIVLSDAGGPVRFTELSRAIPQITQKELTKRLRELEAVGLVERKVYPVVPPRVEYWLTDLGRSLHPLLDALARWAHENGAAMQAARQRLETEARAG
ncbi:MAG TPA: helix-turn-helix domain-containing protein [Lysobacter sp.]|nr:helix-turn-helix domain-containing protein [Lysobacter sp.]